MKDLENSNLLKRYIIFVTGVLINSFGIALITKASLGTAPISSTPYVLSLKFGLSFGLLSFILNCLFIVGQIMLLKKDFEKIQVLQLVVNAVFSLAIDGSMYLLTGLNPEGYVAQFATLIVGCAVLGFGIATEVAPNVLMVPGEGIVVAISKVSKKELGTVKICFDCTLVSMALILSLVFFGKLNGVGIGTIISSVLIGVFIKMYRIIAKFIWK